MIGRRDFLAGGAIVAMGATATSAVAQHFPSPRLIVCPAGRFSGTVEPEGVTAFRGIRYGRAERFRRPLPYRYENRYRAEEFGPACPQRGGYRPQDEDCLFLNIWTARPEVRGSRPVMLYIHGGAYSNGSVTDPLNDGRRLAAEQDVVVVTVNHRLNALGYLYLARLDPRFPDSGNLGQLDLVLALEWVRDNIAAFGGDPNRVMVFGQSGGGAKVATMMGMPAAQGLFHRAITMSGQQVTASGPLNATRRARAYMDRLRARSVDDLLALPSERLVEGLAAEDPIIGGSLYFGPVLDMKWLTRHPFWPDANPQSRAIPMILGNTRDETRAFIDPDGDKVRTLDWSNLADRMAPELRMDISPEWVVARYREHFPDWSPERVFYAATAAGRSWPGQVIEADVRAAAHARTWVYQLDFQSPTQPRRGAPHTMDIALAFGTLDAPGSFTGTGPEARRLSAQVMKHFATFARAGDPNGAGLPHWPIYAVAERQTMLFDTTSRAAPDPRRWERELFARVPYIQPGS